MKRTIIATILLSGLVLAIYLEAASKHMEAVYYNNNQ